MVAACCTVAQSVGGGPGLASAPRWGEAGAGGELQLTDAIAKEIVDSDNVYGYRFKGERYDCGSKSGFLQATVAFGLARPDLRDDLEHYLEDVMAARKAAQ